MDWEKEWKLKSVQLVAKGHSSRIYKATHEPSRRVVAVKVEHEKSRRNHAIEKEVEHLTKANSLGLGPTLYGFDPDKRLVIMDYVVGVSFESFVFDNHTSSKQLLPVIQSLVLQAQKMDQAGLDHGQLAGRGTNILVKKEGKRFVPVIIDFEKASQTRKCHNQSQLFSLLMRNPRARLSQVVREKIGLESLSQTLK